MDARYRIDYPGEFVITHTRWAGGKKDETREWIANPIENHHISGRAACIGHTSEKQYFDYTRLQNHRGGLLGSKNYRHMVWVISLKKCDWILPSKHGESNWQN